MKTPTEYTLLCCLPCPIMNKYYPYVICLLFSLLGGLRIDMWLGLTSGLLMERFVIIDQKLTFSITKVKKVEEYLLKLPKMGKFTTFEEAAGMQVNNAGTTNTNTNNNENQNENQANITPFQGQGVTLGGDSNAVFAQQNAYDEIQKQHNDAQLKEKAREQAIKRDKENREKQEKLKKEAEKKEVEIKENAKKEKEVEKLDKENSAEIKVELNMKIEGSDDITKKLKENSSEEKL